MKNYYQKDQYEECGKTYENMKSRIERPEYKTIYNWVNQNSSVLDLACGEGSLGSWLIEKKGCKYKGIEIDANGVLSAQEKGLNVIRGDVDKGLKEFKDNSFDYAIINVSLMIVHNPFFVLQEIIRVGKKAIVSFPNFAFWRARIDVFLEGIYPKHILYGYEWYNTRSIRMFSYKDFLNLRNKIGFKINKKYFFGRNDWTKSYLASLCPNLFAKVCILEIEKN